MCVTLQLTRPKERIVKVSDQNSVVGYFLCQHIFEAGKEQRKIQSNSGDMDGSESQQYPQLIPRRACHTLCVSQRNLMRIIIIRASQQ